jgi:hypothetical protein
MNTTAAERPALEIKTETFKYDEQPYHRVVLTDLKLQPNRNVRGGFDLVGRCIEGSTTSYLFGHRSSQSAVGQEFIVYGVDQYELEQGSAVRAYCG